MTVEQIDQEHCTHHDAGRNSAGCKTEHRQLGRANEI
jgi:hypothetical protein